MTRVQYIAVLLLAIFVNACTTAPAQTDQSEVNLSGYPPAFRDGYPDGCETARRALGTTRDDSRFESDSMYAAGWRDGFDICSGKKYE